MVDFKAKLKIGLNAHTVAEAARIEVDTVFEDVKKQVLDFTQGVVTIEISTIEVSGGGGIFNSTRALTRFAAEVSGQRPTYETEDVIILRSPKDDTHREHQIAKWKQAIEGYPCVVRFNGQKIEVNDRLSLEACLGDLLASPATGKIVLGLINRFGHKASL